MLDFSKLATEMAEEDKEAQRQQFNTARQRIIDARRPPITALHARQDLTDSERSFVDMLKEIGERTPAGCTRGFGLVDLTAKQVTWLMQLCAKYNVEFIR